MPFGSTGKIDDEAYRQSREGTPLDIVATVKFSTTLELVLAEDAEETESAGTIYYIVTSEPLMLTVNVLPSTVVTT